MSGTLYRLSAFTRNPAGGNPAGGVLLGRREGAGTAVVL